MSKRKYGKTGSPGRILHVRLDFAVQADSDFKLPDIQPRDMATACAYIVASHIKMDVRLLPGSEIELSLIAEPSKMVVKAREASKP